MPINLGRRFSNSRFATRFRDTTPCAELLPRKDFLVDFNIDAAWSEAEKAHQEERHRRKGRVARRPAVRALPAPPIVSQTIKQPDKFQCLALLARGAVEAFEDRLVAEFRFFTSLGEAAEHYIRATFDAARRCIAHESEPAWEQMLEDQSCDSTQFMIADEKFKCSMQPLMSEQQQARWRLRAKTRREQGLPAATARQMLFFVLSYHNLGQKHEGTNALSSLMRRWDRCIADPIKTSTMANFLHIWDRNMLEPTSHAVSQVDLERLFYEALERC